MKTLSAGQCKIGCPFTCTPKPVQVFDKTSVICSPLILISKHHSEAISLGTFPSVQGSDSKTHVITGISGDFWKDFIRTHKVITNLILKLLHFSVNILGQTATSMDSSTQCPWIYMYLSYKFQLSENKSFLRITLNSPSFLTLHFFYFCPSSQRDQKS